MAAEKDLLLAIDNGTQSLKAMIFDREGRQIAKCRVPFEPYFATHPGWAEQDPQVFYQALCQACHGLWKERAGYRNRLAGVALTTQRGTVINLDAEGRPLRPAMIWLDQRRTHGLPPLTGPWGWIFRLLGLGEVIAYLRAEAESNWIRAHEPEIWRRTRHYVLLSGYLTYLLTGELTDSVGCQVAYMPFDYKRQAWAASWDWRWPALGVDPEMLPRLLPPGQVLGAITHRAAGDTGIPAGLPLVAAASDKACEVLGSGSLDPSVGCLSFGTTATINVTHPKYIEPIRLIPPFPSAIPGWYSMEIMIYRGFWMVSWFKEEFGHLEQQLAETVGVEAETLFDRLVEDIAPGAMGLMLQPFWTPGIRTPGPEAKGAVIGFGDVHTRAHLYRSILEGLVYALREGKERIEKRMGTKIDTLRVSGGGSQSRVAMQMTADVFGLPTSRPLLYETSALGAAMNLAVGLGIHPDYPAAAAAMARIGDTFEPDRETHRLYDRLYREVYLRMYARLKPLYERIREITGYPP